MIPKHTRKPLWKHVKALTDVASVEMSTTSTDGSMGAFMEAFKKAALVQVAEVHGDDNSLHGRTSKLPRK